MAKNTGRGYRVGTVKGRSGFKVGKAWFKRDNATGRIVNGSKNQHNGVRVAMQERLATGPRDSLARSVG